MKIAFTICSNNYLSQAKTLGDSLVKYNPDYKFVIGLCDKKNEAIDYHFFEPYEIIEVENIDIPNLDWMIENYNIVELNTSIKPFYFQHFIKKYSNIDLIIYFDPDIKIYNSLAGLELEMKNSTALLTPHIVSPIPLDNKIPDEKVFLNFGIYNLGFIAIKPSCESSKLLDWWSERLSIQSFININDGLFVDQLPMNFAPLFFNDICVSKTPSYNFAYWNFHERTLSLKENSYYVNDKYPLMFFHFSSYNPAKPLEISRFQNRYTFEKESILHKFFTDYGEVLINNKFYELKNIPCYYVTVREALLQKQEDEKERNNSNRIIMLLKRIKSLIIR